MQEEYKRVLERRRSQIVDQVKWTKEFAALLDKYGLLSKEDIKHVETELNSKSRVYAALSKIIGHDESNAFEKFRHLLIENGNISMAESLEFDRKRIRWNFERDIKATCLPNYIDHVSAELMLASFSEPDEHIRQCMIKEARRRLEELRNSIRQHQIDRDNFRTSMWTAVTGKKLSWSAGLSHHAKDSMTLSKIEDIESEKDELILKSTSSLLEMLRKRVTTLKKENESLREVVDNSRNGSSDVVSAPQNEINVSIEDVDDTHNQTVKEFYIDEDNTAASDNDDGADIMCIKKKIFDEALQSLKPFESHNESSQKMETLKAVDSNVDDNWKMHRMMDLIRNAAAEVDMWRNRSHKLNTSVKRMERERTLVRRAVGLSSSNEQEEEETDDGKTFLDSMLKKINEYTNARLIKKQDHRNDQENENDDLQSIEVEDHHHHHQNNDDDDDEQQQLLLCKSRRSSTVDELPFNRTTSESIVEITSRNRRKSMPFLRRPASTAVLPALETNNKTRLIPEATSQESSNNKTATGTSGNNYSRNGFRMNRVKNRKSDPGKLRPAIQRQ